MKRPSLDTYFMTMAYQAATRATCEEAQVGSVLVSAENHILATGYNGTPPGQPECSGKNSCKLIRNRGTNGVYELCPTIHSESNLLAQFRAAHNKPLAPTGARVYVTTFPCLSCLQQLLAAGVFHVVYGSINSWREVGLRYAHSMPEVTFQAHFSEAIKVQPSPKQTSGFVRGNPMQTPQEYTYGCL